MGISCFILLHNYTIHQLNDNGSLTFLNKVIGIADWDIDNERKYLQLYDVEPRSQLIYFSVYLDQRNIQGDLAITHPITEQKFRDMHDVKVDKKYEE